MCGEKRETGRGGRGRERGRGRGERVYHLWQLPDCGPDSRLRHQHSPVLGAESGGTDRRHPPWPRPWGFPVRGVSRYVGTLGPELASLRQQTPLPTPPPPCSSGLSELLPPITLASSFWSNPLLTCHLTRARSPHSCKHTSSRKSPWTTPQLRSSLYSSSRAPVTNILEDFSPLFPVCLLPA